jgi:hypothetical protein
LRKLVIDKNIWLRGEGGQVSKLYRPLDCKQCCVGIYLTACGIPLDSLAGLGTADEVSATVFPEEAEWLISTPKNRAAHGLYSTNDDTTISDESRMHCLTEVFAEHEVEVSFIN